MRAHVLVRAGKTVAVNPLAKTMPGPRIQTEARGAHAVVAVADEAEAEARIRMHRTKPARTPARATPPRTKPLELPPKDKAKGSGSINKIDRARMIPTTRERAVHAVAGDVAADAVAIVTPAVMRMVRQTRSEMR